MNGNSLTNHISFRGGPEGDEAVMMSRGLNMVRGLSFANLQRAKPHVRQIRAKQERRDAKSALK